MKIRNTTLFLLGIGGIYNLPKIEAKVVSWSDLQKDSKQEKLSKTISHILQSGTIKNYSVNSLSSVDLPDCYVDDKASEYNDVIKLVFTDGRSFFIACKKIKYDKLFQMYQSAFDHYKFNKKKAVQLIGLNGSKTRDFISNPTANFTLINGSISEGKKIKMLSWVGGGSMYALEGEGGNTGSTQLYSVPVKTMTYID